MDKWEKLKEWVESQINACIENDSEVAESIYKSVQFYMNEVEEGNI